jgi:hypothetical protein
VNTVMNLWITQKVGNFLTSWVTISFSRRTLLHGVTQISQSLWRTTEKPLFPALWVDRAAHV